MSFAGKSIRIGVIGLGHWGPNHVRVFGQCEGAEVVMAADPSEARRSAVKKLFHDLKTVANPSELIASPEIDAVVIATPTSTHLDLALQAFKNNKHVLLEKPMCLDSAQGEKLLAAQKESKLSLMMGHVFLFNPGIQKMKQDIDKKEYGRLEYLDSTRTNLGPIRADVNVVQDLAVHELSIFDYFFGGSPKWVSANGRCLIGTPREDVAFLTMEYGEGVVVHVHVSWLHPKKIRNLTVVGEKKMVVWDDTDVNEPLRVYDKGLAEEPYYDSFGNFQLLLRDKEVLIPKIKPAEPLKLQAEAFLKHLRDGSPIVSNAEAGLRTLRCLEAIQLSMREEGKRIYLKGASK